MRKEFATVAMATVLGVTGCASSGTTPENQGNILPIVVGLNHLYKTCLDSPWLRSIIVKDGFSAPATSRNLLIGSTREPDPEATGGKIIIVDRADLFALIGYLPLASFHTPSPIDDTLFGTAELKKANICVLVRDPPSSSRSSKK